MDETDLGHVAYEALRAFYYTERMEAGSKPWDQLDEETQRAYNASGQAVARYVQRDTRAQGFAAFVSVGGMDLEQRIATLEKRQDSLDAARERNSARIVKLLNEALSIDGAHHKQWYLRRIADVLGVRPFESGDEGIAP